MQRALSLLFCFLFVSCATTPPVNHTPPEQISLPKTQKQLSSESSFYTVKKGDTLWKISKNYGVSISELMRENKISSSRKVKVNVGQKICIPKRATYPRTSFSWPLNGEIINCFGELIDNAANTGINISARTAQRTVNASAGGSVIFANELKGWGRTIILKHPSDFYTVYANLDTCLVAEGDATRQGESIGQVAAGKDGNFVLHFEIRKKSLPQDPLQYLN